MKKSKILVLFCGISLIVAYHCFAYFGHFGYDDLHYAKKSAELLQGIIDYDDHYSYRIPLLALSSLFYFIFGINDFSSSLPSLLMSTGILSLLYFLLKTEHLQTLIIAFALCIFSEWFLFYSDKLMPDMGLAFFQYAALALLYFYKYHEKQKLVFLYSFTFGIVLFLGFLTKESIVLLFPVLGFFLVSDLLNKINKKFWLYSIMSFSLAFFIYLLSIKLLTGDFFKRFEAIFNNAYLNTCSYDQQSSSILLKRICCDFFQMLSSQGMALGIIFIFPVLFKFRFGLFQNTISREHFWMVTTILLVLSCNFMTISPSSYSPMCIDPRHFLVLIPVAATASAPVLFQFFKNKKYRLELISLLLIIALYSLFVEPNGFWKLYFPLLLLFLVISFTAESSVNTFFFITAFIIILSIKPMDSVLYARKVNYSKQKQHFNEQILKSQSNGLVITDDVQSRLAAYYLGFQKSDIEILNFDSFTFDPSDQRRKLVYLNAHTQYLSKFDEQDAPFYLTQIALNNNLIFEDSNLHITIYEMNNNSFQEEKITPLFTAMNRFEENVMYWLQNNEDMTIQQSYSANHSNALAEFSSTFLLPLDTLSYTIDKTLIVDCELFMLSHEPTDATLVLSLETKDSVYHWENVDPHKFVKAYSNWWFIQHRLSFSSNKLMPNTTLKVYVWNPKKERIFIDDFKINIGEK